MRKADELESPTSCLSKAKDDEYIFVLKSTDRHAPLVVRLWADLRELEGLTRPEKIAEARECAAKMEHWKRHALTSRISQEQRDAIAVVQDLMIDLHICEISTMSKATLDTDVPEYAEPGKDVAYVALKYDGHSEDTEAVGPAPTLLSLFEKVIP